MFKKTLLAALAGLLLGRPFALPAISADDAPPITKQDLEIAVKNLRRFGLACQEFHDVYCALPVNITSKDGKPLLSWRVAILPYIDEKALYDRFKLDEPWDSKHNIPLVEKMPKLYEPLRVKAKSGETFYQMFEGDDALLRPKKSGYSLAFITNLNGTSNTGMVFEAGTTVIWAKPADLPFDKKKPLPKLGGLFDGDFHLVFCDGHVSFYKKNPDDKVMKCVIMPTNTKPFDNTELLKPPGKS